METGSREISTLLGEEAKTKLHQNIERCYCLLKASSSDMLKKANSKVC